MSAVTVLPPPSPKPRLSVRTAAHFVRLPAVEQKRLLQEQKYAQQAPHRFKPQYYRSSREALSSVLVGDLAAARARIQRVSKPNERMHNMRVIEGMIGSLTPRQLRSAGQARYSMLLRGLELRLSPDLHAYEGDEERYIYFNFKAEQFDPSVAATTLELAHWVLQQNGVNVQPKQLEFIDLFTGVLYSGRKCRVRTQRLLEENAKIIQDLWPTI